MQSCQGEVVNSNAFYGRPFCEPRRGGNSDFTMTIWCFWISNCTFVICLNICYCLMRVCVCACTRVCVRERKTGSHLSTSEIVLIAACLQTHKSFITVSVTRLFPTRLELMVKIRTLLTVFTFIWKAEARDYGKGLYISDTACGVRPITMHGVSWPIRDCACRKEGLCRKQSVWERRGIEDIQ